MKPLKAMKRHFRSALMVAALASVLAACGTAKPFNYTQGDQIQPGPGLFSGKDGKFSLYRK
ncbi:MAG: hypothetical protein QF578_24155 [Alphaproteobacteria bacterium]|jgi:hypothetical protein|nr:hypothetical protein [Alphaproteobacteria bacterium]MDP6567940.1 hypothetical protein [Alphaproteobacteria bacterium]MDP6812350.1 hypothetical protein [Alphaproteobacteria bacterium]